MYVGRLVCAGRTAGRLWAGYRVASRSFPDRHAVRLNASTVAVLPRDVRDIEKSPFLFYGCARLAGGVAVVGNGSHADAIFERIARGYPMRDAMALVLLALGPEDDALHTPRIAAALAGDRACLGIVTEGGIRVDGLPLEGDGCFMVATYGMTAPSRLAVEAASAEDAAKKLYGLSFELPVCSVGVFSGDGGFEAGIYNGP